MSRNFVSMLYLAASVLLPGPAEAQLRVVTSTPDLYDIARQVGGTRVVARSIGQGYQDPHFIEAKPSFVLDLAKADVWAFVGLDLEIGWMPLLLDGARNPKIRPGGAGYVDVSKAIPVIDVPTGNVDRSQGDVHALGNPHYWLDPANGRRIAWLFRDKFTQLDPAGASNYTGNAKAFEARLGAAEQAWAADLAKIKGKPVVAWHTSWRYFAAYTGLNIVGFMEPKPGVPPSPSHLAALVATMKQTGAKAIIMEPFYDRKTADKIARETGARVLIVPPSVGGTKALTDYTSVMKNAISMVASAMK